MFFPKPTWMHKSEELAPKALRTDRAFLLRCAKITPQELWIRWLCMCHIFWNAKQSTCIVRQRLASIARLSVNYCSPNCSWVLQIWETTSASKIFKYRKKWLKGLGNFGIILRVLDGLGRFASNFETNPTTIQNSPAQQALRLAPEELQRDRSFVIEALFPRIPDEVRRCLQDTCGNSEFHWISNVNLQGDCFRKDKTLELEQFSAK